MKDENMTEQERLEHYRLHMKIYGTMIVELADSSEEVLKIIKGKNLGPLLQALRKRIEDSPADTKALI